MPIPVAWKLYDPVANETVVFPNNPREMGSPHPQKTISFGGRAARGTIAGSANPAEPTKWSFSGKSRDQGFYNALVSFRNKENPIQVTDHLDRTWEMVITGIGINEARPSALHATRFTYTVEGFITARIS